MIAERGSAVIVDARPPSAFVAGHIVGALSLPFSAKGLGDRLRAVLPAESSIVLVVNDGAMAASARTQLEAVGYSIDRLIVGDPGASSEEFEIEPLAEIGADELQAAIDQHSLIVLDVREPIEWDTGHVPGALLISLASLPERVGELPRDRPIAVICEAGIRSSTAASILLRDFRGDVVNVIDGTAGYRARGYILDFPEIGS